MRRNVEFCNNVEGLSSFAIMWRLCSNVMEFCNDLESLKKCGGCAVICWNIISNVEGCFAVMLGGFIVMKGYHH